MVQRGKSLMKSIKTCTKLDSVLLISVYICSNELFLEGILSLNLFKGYFCKLTENLFKNLPIQCDLIHGKN